VVFTSGGTEANMLALSPGWETADAGRGFSRLLVSAIEHPSVLSGGRFPAEAVRTIAVSPAGVVDLEDLDGQLAEALAAGDRPLVSIMLANNETGVVQPVREAAARVHAAGGLLHVDAVQACGKISVDINALGADLLTISAHKLGGPQGVGALVRRSERLHLSDPPARGGGQERGLRAGTENVVAVTGFGAAADAIRGFLEVESGRTGALRDRLEAGLSGVSPQLVIFGANVDRLPNTTLAAVPGMKAETALIALDLEGVAVSSGAACSSGKVTPSHVLAAMSVPVELARGAVRVSLGYSTQESDVDRFLAAWEKLVRTLSKGSHKAAA
jgi:cysteine desulfurase